MGKLYERIDDRLQEFIQGQPMFFVATAPRDGGHVNVSPKGYADTFAVVDEQTVAYLDLYGSGSETIVHPRENGRIRSIIVVDVERIADSCGYSVPHMDLVGERALLDDQHARRTAEQWTERTARNSLSLDGLPALELDHPAPPGPLSPVSGPGGE
jgi:hypothetical protein